MKAMQRRCELLMELKPGPPAYGQANPDPLRCCEQETWSFHDHAFERASLCTITLRKRAPRGQPCTGRIPASDADLQDDAGQPRASRAGPRKERREPMRVVRVLAPGPDGEGEEIGTVESVIEARRIAETWGWCRAYRSYVDGPNMVYDCLSVQRNYAWDRERDLWVSEDRGGFGEPLTIPVSNDQSDALRASMSYLHQIAELADSPSRCVRCDGILQPGTDSWRSYGRGSESGIFCHDCARPPIWWDPEPRSRTCPDEPRAARAAKSSKKTFGYTDDGGFWISPDDPLFNANFSVHEIVGLADSPMWCARCGRMLEPGTDAARAFDSAGERGIVCSDCGGSRPRVQGKDSPE